MLPLSTPVITSGLTYIKIQLVKAEVASAVCLRLHRPRDASTLGLSQIKLLGLTAFGNTSSATVSNPFLPSEDQVSKTSIGWLRLLHHCLTHVGDLESIMASAAAPTANLLQTCAALLMSPYCGMHSPNIEAVLVKIGLQSTRIGLKLIDILLRNCAASGTDPADLNSPLLFGRLNGLSSDSTIDILYQLGTTQDPGTKDRLLYNWSMSLPCNMVLKKAVDSLLCSMCHIHPNYFSLLMAWMGITPLPVQNQHRLSMTDDSKKQDLSAGLTDDSKNAQAPITLTESHLATLAAACQSPEAIKQLLDSGLPSLLVKSLASFCFGLLSNSDFSVPFMEVPADRNRRQHPANKVPLTADLVAPVLRFLTEVGNSHAMKDWLGGPEVNPLWTALLFLLCHSSASAGGHQASAQPSGSRYTLASLTSGNGLTTQQRTATENATVAFFLQCISCHPCNQRLMAQVDNVELSIPELPKAPSCDDTLGPAHRGYKTVTRRNISLFFHLKTVSLKETRDPPPDPGSAVPRCGVDSAGLPQPTLVAVVSALLPSQLAVLCVYLEGNTELSEKEKGIILDLALSWDLPGVNQNNRRWLFERLLLHAVIGCTSHQIKQLRRGLKDTMVWPLLHARADVIPLVLPSESDALYTSQGGWAVTSGQKQEGNTDTKQSCS
ncbi:UNVERIFIED_CONTAM: hypothetical protein FKN15_025304 [Acipenser sinensis]